MQNLLIVEMHPPIDPQKAPSSTSSSETHSPFDVQRTPSSSMHGLMDLQRASPSSSEIHSPIDLQSVSSCSSSCYTDLQIDPQKGSSSSSYPSHIDVTADLHEAPSTSSSTHLSPETSDTAENLSSGWDGEAAIPITTIRSEAVEEILLTIPGAIVHLIDKRQSVELGSGELYVVRLVQSGNTLAVFARLGYEMQWPLAKDVTSVKLDPSHYFFSLHVPPESGEAESVLNYGLTFGSVTENPKLDGILQEYCCFSEHSASTVPGSEPTALAAAEAAAAAYWTTLAPNVEEYSGCVARAIAAGSGQLVRGIFWCGDVTVERLKWGNEFLKKRMEPNSKPAKIDKHTKKRIKRAKKVTRMSQKVMTGLLCGVLKVTGYFTSSVVQSKTGQKICSLLPGEVVLASLDGFGKVCDAVEVVGKNVLTTSSVVTTELVAHRYGEEAGEAAKDGLCAAGNAAGAAWAVFRIRNILHPKGINVITTSTLSSAAAKAAADVNK